MFKTIFLYTIVLDNLPSVIYSYLYHLNVPNCIDFVFVRVSNTFNSAFKYQTYIKKTILRLCCWISKVSHTHRYIYRKAKSIQTAWQDGYECPNASCCVWDILCDCVWQMSVLSEIPAGAIETFLQKIWYRKLFENILKDCLFQHSVKLDISVDICQWHHIV